MNALHLDRSEHSFHQFLVGGADVQHHGEERVVPLSQQRWRGSDVLQARHEGPPSRTQTDLERPVLTQRACFLDSLSSDDSDGLSSHVRLAQLVPSLEQRTWELLQCFERRQARYGGVVDVPEALYHWSHDLTVSAFYLQTLFF